MPNHQQLFDQVCSHARQTALLGSIEAVLGWDERTMLPRTGGEYRAEQMTRLAGMIHESQSRLWENLVGRGHPFWQWLYPEAQRRFPAALGDVPLDGFYFAVNDVRPSLIRVEADEATLAAGLSLLVH